MAALKALLAAQTMLNDGYTDVCVADQANAEQTSAHKVTSASEESCAKRIRDRMVGLSR